MTVAKTVTLGGNAFSIRPFPAFTAANVSGEIGGVLAPILAGVIPLLGGDSTDVMNMDVGGFSTALSSLSGDKLEKVMYKLLVQHRNISVQLEGEKDDVLLDKDITDEVFCGSAEDMFILAFNVIQTNFKGFFGKIGNLSGFRKILDTTKTTESSGTDG
jgi:hypothetical protein